jgi:uncharacterized protein YdiU (UPF0061 family)
VATPGGLTAGTATGSCYGWGVPVSPAYHPDPRLHALGGAFADAVEPARFPRHASRWRNQRWAARVGLDTLTDAEWEAAFARFEPLPGNLAAPLAMRYHGHQFRQYNPALGDGRGFLYAQLRDDRGRLLDLATKGSGQTPWSRGGDGRLTLKGGVRELLATELLEAQGVETSKTFSLFETGERLHRNDEPSPTRACVLVRLGHGHLRFGSFQRHAYHEDLVSLRALVAYALEHHAPELCHAGPRGPAMLLALVVRRAARLCAQWMAAGFVHGVLNTDNLNVTGESFDYGPWRWLPTFDPRFTAAYFDHSGLYAYGNQPEAVRWALAQLAAALAPVAGGAALPVDAPFAEAFEAALDAEVVRRLGVRSRGPLRDRLLRDEALGLLAASGLPFERLFFDWYGGPVAETRARRSPAWSVYAAAPARLRHELAGYQPLDEARQAHAYFQRDAPRTLLIDEVEALWAPIAAHDDWSALHRALDELAVMRDALA